MIYSFSVSPVAFVLIIVISVIDLYVFAASLRLILSQLSATRTSTACRALQELVDPIPNRVDYWLTAWRPRPSPPWASWVIVIGVGIVARHILILFLVSICQN